MVPISHDFHGLFFIVSGIIVIILGFIGYFIFWDRFDSPIAASVEPTPVVDSVVVWTNHVEMLVGWYHGFQNVYPFLVSCGLEHVFGNFLTRWLGNLKVGQFNDGAIQPVVAQPISDVVVHVSKGVAMWPFRSKPKQN